MTTNRPVCATCNKPHGVDGWSPIHPFNDGSRTGTAVWTPDPPGAVAEPVVSKFPFDPVLRQALITKGIITIDDLTAAEKQINAVMEAVHGQTVL